MEEGLKEHESWCVQSQDPSGTFTSHGCNCDLKPCPFCGGAARLEPTVDAGDCYKPSTEPWVRCSNSACAVSIRSVAAWNKRLAREAEPQLANNEELRGKDRRKRHGGERADGGNIQMARGPDRRKA